MRKYMRYILLFILPFLFGSAQAQTRSNGDLETIVISEFQPEITRNIQKIVDIPAIRQHRRRRLIINSVHVSSRPLSR
jgi:hypothetical protein